MTKITEACTNCGKIGFFYNKCDCRIQITSTLETQNKSLLAKVMELEEINQRQARIIADLRASKAVENGAGNSAVYQRDEDVLTDEQARVLEMVNKCLLWFNNHGSDFYQSHISTFHDLTMMTYLSSKDMYTHDLYTITDKGRAALVKYNAAQIKNAI
jgi:hypothetical protein